MATGRYDLERRVRNGPLNPMPELSGQKGVVPSPHDRGRSHDLAEPRRECCRIRAVERQEMLHEGVTSLAARERPNVLFDRSQPTLVVHVPAQQVLSEYRKQPGGR